MESEDISKSIEEDLVATNLKNLTNRFHNGEFITFTEVYNKCIAPVFGYDEVLDYYGCPLGWNGRIK